MSTHAFTSELSANFPTFENWLIEKVGSDIAATILKSTPDNISVEFGSFYDYWLNEFKITHIIMDEGKEPNIVSYKNLSAERITYATNVVNTISTGKELT